MGRSIPIKTTTPSQEPKPAFEVIQRSKWMYEKKSISEARVQPEDIDKYLATGWEFGRNPKRYSYSKESLQAIRADQQRKKNSIWISKGEETKRILKSEFPSYKEQGWEVGNEKAKGNKYATDPAGHRKKLINFLVRTYNYSESEVRENLEKGNRHCGLCKKFYPKEDFLPGDSYCKNPHLSANSVYYINKLKEQEGKCAICYRVDDSRFQRDHNHNCPKGCKAFSRCEICSRGLLCGSCNGQLGWLERAIRNMETPNVRFKPDTWEAQAHQYLQKYELPNS